MSQDNNTTDTVVNSLSSELEALKEIYLEEFQTEDEDTRTVVSVNLSPSTADLKDQQYVCLTLQLTVCKQQYPQEPPTINIRNPRGLSEDIVARIVTDIKKIADDRKGTNMLYHLIDFVKESLTTNNFPSDKCMICLYDFTKDDAFVVTKCFHHFHCYCLAHYIKKSEEESTEAKGLANGDKPSDTDSQPCPVCREDQDFSNLVKQEDYPPPSLSSKPIPGETVMLEEARQKQESFAPMFEKQQQQGGIINEEEEKNKFLLRTSDMNGASSSGSTSSSTLTTSEYGSSKQSSPAKCLESSNDNNLSAAHSDAKSKLNGSANIDGVGKQSEDKEDDEWADAKPEISPDEAKETKEESKDSNVKAESDPSKSESGSSPESSNKETEGTNGKNESEQETEGKDGKTEKDANKETKTKRNKSSRRNSRRNRTRSSGRRASAGDGTTKTTNGETISQNGNNRRNRSRRRNRTSSYDPNNYGADYRSQNYRPNNRGRPRMRGQVRNNVGYTSNGGLPSPPYKRNFGNGVYPEEVNNLRSDSYNQESYRDRDRPGFYAARVIRPSAGNNANSNRTRNGTRGSEDSSKASVSPQADSSELTQSTSEQEQQQSRPRSRSKNKRRNRSNRNRTSSRSQNGRYSESEYQNSNVQQQVNGYSNSNKINNRQGYNYDYNYRSQGSFNKRTSYYNGNYPNYNYGYGGNYNAGYGNGYGNYNYYGRYNNGNYNYGNYNNGNYYRQRSNYSNAPQRNNGYRSSNYKPRKRTDTGQSQSSVKSNTTPTASSATATTSTTSNSNTTETVAPQVVAETITTVEVNA